MLPKITRSGQLGNTRLVCKEILDRHFARECRSHRNQESRPRNQDKSRKTVNVEDTSSKALVAINEAGSDWSYMADDEVPTNMALMAFSDLEALNSKTCLFAPPTIDSSNSDLEEFQHPEFKGYGPKVSKRVCLDTSNEIKKNSDALIIKVCVFDSDEYESEDMVLKSDNVQHKPEQANQPRKVSQNPRNNRTNWNEMRTRKLGVGEIKWQVLLGNNGLLMLSPQHARHMIRNISHLINFKEHDRGYVAFGGGAKGGKITGKGTIKTGRSPALSFMRPFGCHVTILNTLDQLVKFNGKLDEGIFVGYSTISKAFRVYNIKTRKVEENLHITFLENKPMIAGGRPEWLFNIDALSKLMNYTPVPAGTTSNDFVGKGASFDVGQSSMETGPSQDDILMPLWKDKSLFDSYSQASDGHNKDNHGPYQASKSDNEERPNAKSGTKLVNTVGPVNTATPTYADYPNDPLMPNLEDDRIFNDAYDDRDEDAEAEYNNLETIISMEPKKVKEKQEKDKIETKPDKNEKRGKTRQCRRPITVEKEENEEKYKLKGQNMQIQEVYLIQVKRQGLNVPFAQSNITRVKAAKVLKKFNRYSFFETPKVLLLAWDRVFEIKDAFGNKQYKLEDLQELFRKLFNEVQNVHEELAEYINTPGWNRPAFCDDDDDDDEPDNSLSMGDKHLDTIPATKSDEVIKSSFEDLIPIPSESEGIPDTINDDSLYNENIEYVEASPHDSEVVSLEVADIVIPKDEEIEDDNLREKLLNVYLLIANIEALKDSPTPSSEFLTKSSSISPKSFLEETNTFENSLPEFENFYFDLGEISSGSTITHSDISLPDYEAFYFNNDHIEEISSGSATTHSDISLSEYDSFIFDLSNDQFPPTDRSDFTHEDFVDELAHIISPPEYYCFYFRNLPNPGELISILNSEIRENLFSTTSVYLPVEDDHSPLLAYVVWIFLAYLTYPVIPPHLYSFENEDTIFDQGIAINRFYLNRVYLIGVELSRNSVLTVVT
nr:retrovirus-related Pol polyprotein from transposon TNT 1-94 [Tanacetum cinerariifolium]